MTIAKVILFYFVLLLVTFFLFVVADANAQAQINRSIDPSRTIPPNVAPPHWWEWPTFPQKYPPRQPEMRQLPMEFQKRYLPPPEYDHEYDGALRHPAHIPRT